MNEHHPYINFTDAQEWMLSRFWHQTYLTDTCLHFQCERGWAQTLRALDRRGLVEYQGYSDDGGTRIWKITEDGKRVYQEVLRYRGEECA